MDGQNDTYIAEGTEGITGVQGPRDTPWIYVLIIMGMRMAA